MAKSKGGRKKNESQQRNVNNLKDPLPKSNETRKINNRKDCTKKRTVLKSDVGKVSEGEAAVRICKKSIHHDKQGLEVGTSKYWKKNNPVVAQNIGESIPGSDTEDFQENGFKLKGKTGNRMSKSRNNPRNLPSGSNKVRKAKNRKNNEINQTKKNVSDKTCEGEPLAKVHKKTTENEKQDAPLETDTSKYWMESADVDSKESHSNDEDDSSSDWEEVEELPGPSCSDFGDIKKQLPDHPVEIIIPRPDIFKKRGKCGFNIEDWFRLKMNKYKRETQIYVHKVHILCLLAIGLHQNDVCNDINLQGRALSIVPGYLTDFPVACELWIKHLKKLVNWFINHFTLNPDLKEDVSKLENRLEQNQAASVLELVLLFVITCRALNLKVRLINSLQPVTFKAKDLKLKTEKKAPDSEPSRPEGNSLSSKLSLLAKNKSEKQEPKTHRKRKCSQDKKVNKASGLKQNKSRHRDQPQRSCSSNVSYKEEDNDMDLSIEQVDGPAGRQVMSKGEKDMTMSNSDDEFVEEEITFRSPNPRVKRRSRSGSDVKPDLSRNCSVYDYWSEVYLEKENKWICVDCVQAEVDHPENMESRATKPMCYVIGYENNGCIKDVTKRYASDYLAHVRKLRIDPEWWNETLQPYLPRNPDEMEKHKKEDLQLEEKLQTQPFPKTISEFKNHPLYALKRHFLKFEALYPESAVPLGFIKGEPIYARECVHTLHSRENWLKEGRVVKLGEEPYKLVKSRKRPVPNNINPQKEELRTELYGIWQTEEYKPPPAVDGKVPKNEYGNIEVYKPSMLPVGTVHLKLTGIEKIANKLEIDCAPAMVGWEQHGLFAHPKIEGIVVCKEHEDILVAAWNEQEMIQQQKEAEKREKRALNNWKHLVKHLLLREKMKIKFNLKEPEQMEEDHNVCKGTKEANDVDLSWPRNRQSQQGILPKKEAAPPFPFEMEQM